MLTAQEIERLTDAIMRRCEAARMVGGIPYRDILEGRAVPDGWVYDFITEYFVPPNAHLDAGLQ